MFTSQWNVEKFKQYFLCDIISYLYSKLFLLCCEKSTLYGKNQHLYCLKLLMFYIVFILYLKRIYLYGKIVFI